MNGQHETSWADEEFVEVNLGDKRLDARLVKLCNRFSDAPESPINQACVDWAETKAAYRFFQNDMLRLGRSWRPTAARQLSGPGSIKRFSHSRIPVTSCTPATKRPKGSERCL